MARVCGRVDISDINGQLIDSAVNITIIFAVKIADIIDDVLVLDSGRGPWSD